MEQLIRYALLGIGAAIILIVLGDAFRKKNRLALTKEVPFEELDDLDQGEPLITSFDLTEVPNIFESESGERCRVLATQNEPLLEKTSVAPEKFTEKPTPLATEKATSSKNPLCLYLMAPSDQTFRGYPILQALLDNGLHYGDMQIFHYYTPEQTRLFSVASANKPGDFDLAKFSQFVSHGLIFFMLPEDCQHPLITFDLMLATMRNIAQNLGGEIRVSYHEPLNSTTEKNIRKKLELLSA